MNLKDIMTSNPSSVGPDSTVNQAAQIMNNLNVGSVPVCNGDKPVGIITDRDITIRNVAQNADNNSPVESVMSNNLIYGSPEMSVHEAAQLMSQNQVRRLPVVENGNLVGIVSLGDLAVESQADMEAGEALSTISTPSKPQK